MAVDTNLFFYRSIERTAHQFIARVGTRCVKLSERKSRDLRDRENSKQCPNLNSSKKLRKDRVPSPVTSDRRVAEFILREALALRSQTRQTAGNLSLRDWINKLITSKEELARSIHPSRKNRNKIKNRENTGSLIFQTFATHRKISIFTGVSPVKLRQKAHLIFNFERQLYPIFKN
jgi:hypothetical protein